MNFYVAFLKLVAGDTRQLSHRCKLIIEAHVQSCFCLFFISNHKFSSYVSIRLKQTKQAKQVENNSNPTLSICRERNFWVAKEGVSQKKDVENFLSHSITVPKKLKGAPLVFLVFLKVSGAKIFEIHRRRTHKKDVEIFSCHRKKSWEAGNFLLFREVCVFDKLYA